MWTKFINFLDAPIRTVMTFITNFLPVKIIRNDDGVPFLYRYHLLSFGKDGPGICIHNFVGSDPDRGYHDHPWTDAVSFILCGGYDERIYSTDAVNGFVSHRRNPFTFNYLKGNGTYHRVMVDEKKSPWTLFAFTKRSKTWGMIDLKGKYKAMSTSISDLDGGWWNILGKGARVHKHLPLNGSVIATVDSIIISQKEKMVLLIKRGKEPFKGMWAFPGGRIDPSDENVEVACYRELFEETNLTSQDVDLKYIKTIGDKIRDPRGFCLTNIFLGYVSNIESVSVKAGDDAVNYRWFSLDSLPEMAFDHHQILNDVMINSHEF